MVRHIWNNPSQPQIVSHFRLISLCNAAYKVVTKVLNKFKVCLPKLVSSYHTGFILGKNTQENIMIAKEVIHSLHHMKGKKGYFIVKVDLSKVYDKISWEFIWSALWDSTSCYYHKHYPMMTDLLPKVCINEIQRMQKNFIWGDTMDKKRYHVVSWKTITTPKAEGGLRLRKLEQMNTGLHYETCLAIALQGRWFVVKCFEIQI